MVGSTCEGYVVSGFSRTSGLIGSHAPFRLLSPVQDYIQLRQASLLLDDQCTAGVRGEPENGRYNLVIVRNS
jgi:hypothetical protein